MKGKASTTSTSSINLEALSTNFNEVGDKLNDLGGRLLDQLKERDELKKAQVEEKKRQKDETMKFRMLERLMQKPVLDEVELEISSSSSSSSSSTDDIYDQMVMNFINESHRLQVMQNAVLVAVNNSVQQNEHKRQRKRRITVPRNREAAHDNLVSDYFSDQPVYDETTFRRRFRMRRPLFLRIVNTLSATNRYFQQHPDATMRLGASPLQKCTTAIRMLAYGCSADQIDEYLKLGESTARECFAQFVDGVIAQFATEYLRKPTLEDIQRLLREGEDRAGWKGIYQGRSKTATVILEAIASRDLWIWHAFFGTPGSRNDINVVQRSPVFDDIINNRAPQVLFTVNGNNYNKGYYLTDGIYPKWSTFIDAIAVPQTLKDKLFTTRQESARKDVERAFGVLQARFAIVRKPALAWSVELMWKIMMTCIIIHNMIVEDECDTYLNYKDPLEFAQEQPENMSGSSSTRNATTFIVTPGQYDPDNFSRLIASRGEIRDRQVHEALKNDLVEHSWAKSRSSVEN
ncbi:uncharacterized protein LOC110722221 [Chenopodium quinoa]|uniref:uncharacterized protein LOC110722221 n=1 Tax=Chenopodium quinoa TaxID=63459 RepID=UPI000B792AF4|nr:uncharacterized protein LOC110722221 [Chenopodium quinoa]